MTEINDAAAALASHAERVQNFLWETSGRHEGFGLKPHTLLALAYMVAVRRMHEEMRSRNPTAVKEAKDAAARLGVLGDYSDCIISYQPHERVEIVNVLGDRYVVLSTLLGTARPLWALFHDDLVDRWRKLDGLFGKKEVST